jgi:alpha-galactosidase
VRTEFLVNDEWHDDFENTGTFDHTTTLTVNGNGATRSGDKRVGDLLKTSSSSAGPAVVTINKTDPRFIYGTRVHVTFKINGESYTDFEELAPLSGTTNLQLNGNGGKWDGTQWTGDFLRVQ